MLQGLSIEEMSEKRGLGQSTIINHLAKLIEQDPSIDISRFKPTDDILQKVTLSYKRVLAEDKDENFNDDGSMKLRPLYEDLKPDLGYNAIRLALLFVVT